MKLSPIIAMIFIFAKLCASYHNILCVGDSITRGYQSSNHTLTSYPARLQQILSLSSPSNVFNVINAGVDGATALKVSSIPYWSTVVFQNSLSVVKKMSVLVIQLGTNDAIYFKMGNETQFIIDYKSLIETYRDLNPKLKVFIAIPPPVYQVIENYYVTGVNHKLPSLIKRISHETKCHLIDVFNALGGDKLTKKECFNQDGVHPNDMGHNLIAETVAAELRPFL